MIFRKNSLTYCSKRNENQLEHVSVACHIWLWLVWWGGGAVKRILRRRVEQV